MKRFMTILAVLSVLVLATSATAEVYGWTISGSATDPFVNTGTPAFAVGFFTLHFVCDSDGMSAAEFDIGGTMTVYAFTPLNGYLNAGGATNLMLAVGGCPVGPLAAGTVMALDLGGAIYPMDSAANALNVTVNCAATDMFDNNYIGYSTDGSAPVSNVADASALCVGTGVEPSNWGAIKGLYR
ncbi:MAG: hypothetical protein QGH59_09215 [Gemmatimonadota bacterium]|jgi:hypothetical protein|nr:hypothetical protein [Gemmatimonadota bacterium]MDP6461947.1 hypothetical protein [Gemmatimonadota bacterium]